MHLFFRNVTEAFSTIPNLFNQRPGYTPSFPLRRTTSRNGVVLVMDEPVLVTYSHPRERVLLNPARDCNPFFHLYESLWMLAGWNDVAPLAYYNKRMMEFSDDGRTLNGAYGYRWRKHYVPFSGIADYRDQLDILINHLKADPNSRRAVLQMWNVEDDLLKIGPTCDRCGGDGKAHGADRPFEYSGPGTYPGPCPKCEGSPPSPSKDVCCNLSVMFSLRGAVERPTPDSLVTTPVLDMTVTNRSNDLVWGMLGANYVHFTFLQEYMAARLGAEVGRYHHFTNNLHAYVGREDWKPDEWLKADRTEYHEPSEGYTQVPLVRDPKAFDIELQLVVDRNKDYTGALTPQQYVEPFFETVAKPAFRAWHAHKDGDTKRAVLMSDKIADDAWRAACWMWLERRVK